MSTEIVKLSKFLSLVLRHKPEEIGLTLDENGWADVEELLRLAKKSGRNISRDLLDRIVRENDKQRFAFNDDRHKIRASQGHSIDVDLKLPPQEPPEFLYHGTASQSISSIREQGLEKRSRQFVHLSMDIITATKVGGRHGKPVILIVKAGQMHRAGFNFYLSENGVWLTESVPVPYLEFPS